MVDMIITPELDPTFSSEELNVFKEFQRLDKMCLEKWKQLLRDNGSEGILKTHLEFLMAAVESP